jgi:hypothetical protein
MQSAVKYPEWYSCKSINDVEDILCYTKPGDNPANWNIALPEDLIKPTFKWCHQVTGLPGSKKLYGQLGQDTIIEIYIEWFTTSTVTFARETNETAKGMDSYQSMKSNQFGLKNVPWT